MLSVPQTVFLRPWRALADWGVRGNPESVRKNRKMGLETVHYLLGCSILSVVTQPKYCNTQQVNA